MIQHAFLQAEPGKLCIKRCQPAILFISLLITSLFNLAIMTLSLFFVSFQRH